MEKRIIAAVCVLIFSLGVWKGYVEWTRRENKDILRHAADLVLVCISETGCVSVADMGCDCTVIGADYWGNTIELVSREMLKYRNVVVVQAQGVMVRRSDIHKRRIIKDMIQEVGANWGRGLVRGIKEGILGDE